MASGFFSQPDHGIRSIRQHAIPQHIQRFEIQNGGIRCHASVQRQDIGHDHILGGNWLVHRRRAKKNG